MDELIAQAKAAFLIDHQYLVEVLNDAHALKRGKKARERKPKVQRATPQKARPREYDYNTCECGSEKRRYAKQCRNCYFDARRAR